MGPPMTIIKPEFEADDQKEQDGDKTEPRLPDDDGGDDDGLNATFTSDRTLCTWSDDMEEHRRVFVFDKLADSDIAGYALVENMDAVCQWLKSGRMAKHERKLKPVRE